MRIKVVGCLTLALAVLLLVAGQAVAVPQGQRDSAGYTANLPQRYAAWHVTATATAGHPHTVAVDYDSPALGGRRIHNTVYLPAGYHRGGPALPVLYRLHGTVFPQFYRTVRGAAATILRQVRNVLPRLGSASSDTRQAGSPRDAGRREQPHFILAALDTGASPFCRTCLWIDGRQDVIPNLPPLTAATVPAETVLYSEFIPLVQQLFHTRTDRAGRGLMGFSMGGVGAWIQAVRHPDRFGFVAVISGGFDTLGDLVAREGILELVGYLRDQGYGLSVTEPRQWRRFDPAYLVRNLRGARITLLFSSGDGCLSLADLSAPLCRKHPALKEPVHAAEEALIRNDAAHYAAPELARAGVPATQVQTAGVHGANNAVVYAQHIVPMANRAFARGHRPHTPFTYTSADHRFRVWGYRIDTGRAHDNRFFTLGPARHDGRAFTLHGTGTVTATTPATLTPASRYRVRITGGGAPPRTAQVTTDAAGRARVTVDLPAGHTTRRVTITPDRQAP